MIPGIISAETAPMMRPSNATHGKFDIIRSVCGSKYINNTKYLIVVVRTLCSNRSRREFQPRTGKISRKCGKAGLNAPERAKSQAFPPEIA